MPGHHRQGEAAVGVVGQKPDGEAALAEQTARQRIRPKADLARRCASPARAFPLAIRPVSFSAFDAVEMLTPAAAATSWMVILPLFPPDIFRAPPADSDVRKPFTKFLSSEKRFSLSFSGESRLARNVVGCFLFDISVGQIVHSWLSGHMPKHQRDCFISNSGDWKCRL